MRVLRLRRTFCVFMQVRMVVVEEQELCGWVAFNCTRVLSLRSARSLRKRQDREKHIPDSLFLGRV